MPACKSGFKQVALDARGAGVMQPLWFDEVAQPIAGTAQTTQINNIVSTWVAHRDKERHLVSEKGQVIETSHLARDRVAKLSYRLIARVFRQRHGGYHAPQHQGRDMLFLRR